MNAMIQTEKPEQEEVWYLEGDSDDPGQMSVEESEEEKEEKGKEQELDQEQVRQQMLKSHGHAAYPKSR